MYFKKFSFCKRYKNRPFLAPRFPPIFSEENRTFEGVKTFFALHLILGGKLDVCRRGDFFCSSLDFGQKIGRLQT